MTFVLITLYAVLPRDSIAQGCVTIRSYAGLTQAQWARQAYVCL